MNIDQPIPASADAPPRDPSPDHAEAYAPCGAGDADRETALHLRMLRILAEYAMEVSNGARQRYAEQLERDREAAEAPDAAADRRARALRLDFDRAARAVRQTLALRHRIVQDQRAWAERGAAAVAAERAEAAKRAEAQRQARLERRRGRVRREIEQVIKKECNPFEINDLKYALNDRLAREHLDSDFGDAPLKEIFLRICRDVRIPTDWVQWWDSKGDPEDLPDLPAASAAPPGATAEKSEAGAASAPPAKRVPVSPALAALLEHGRKFKGAFPDAFPEPGKPAASAGPGRTAPTGRGPPWR